MTSVVAELGSVATLWADAFSRVEFSLPEESFIQSLEQGLDGVLNPTMMDSHAAFAFGNALRLTLRGCEPDFVARLVSSMRRNRERFAAFAADESVDAELVPASSLLWLAAGAHMSEACAPERELLTHAAGIVVQRLTSLGKRKNLHAAAWSRLQYAGYAAVLAGDLALLRSVLAVRPTSALYPRHWSLLHAIADASTETTMASRNVLRCTEDAVRGEFMTMFRQHRLPGNRHAQAELGAEGLLAGGQLGGYVYTWIYLQTFAPEPTVQSDWNTLRGLLIG